MKKVQVHSRASYSLVLFMTQAFVLENFFTTTEEVELDTKSRYPASVPTRRTRPQFFTSDVDLAVAPKEADPE
jgi:hypothetical protein